MASTFDLVVSNLYPFLDGPGIDTIDIGGPAMVRAAAKNHAFVTIVTDPSQYAPLLEEMDANDNTVGDELRRVFGSRRSRAPRRSTPRCPRGCRRPRSSRSTSTSRSMYG